MTFVPLLLAPFFTLASALAGDKPNILFIAVDLSNLAGRAENAAVQKKLRTELDRWLAAQNDPGTPLDTVEAHTAAKRGQHSFPSKPSAP